MSPKLAASLMERKLAQAEDFAENAPDLVTEVKGRKGAYPAGTVEVAGKHYDLSPGLPVTADDSNSSSRIRANSSIRSFVRDLAQKA